MTLHDTLDARAQETPDQTALRFEGAAVSYATLAHEARRASEALASLGVSRGDRVAYLGYNQPQMLVALFALARIGAMLLPLNFRLAPAEHRTLLADAEPKALIVDPAFLDAAHELRSAFPHIELISLAAASEHDRSWTDLLAADASPLSARGQACDPVLLVYTSGTTGRPKGAVHTQDALLWNVRNAVHCHAMTRTDRVLTALPLFHVGGLCIQTVPGLCTGATVMLHPRFDAGRWLRDVAGQRITLSLLVPATLKAVLEHPDWPSADLSSLRALFTGSSTIPSALFPPFHARGIPLGQVYGATETGPVSIYLRAEDAMQKPGSAGRGALHGRVRLVNDSEQDVAHGEIGEIWVNAPNVMQAYWRDPANANLQDGWFKTGDLARQDEDGYYWVVGRSKDMIISGGENIYPTEIENVLSECDEIVEAAVIGVPDERWGEVAVAAVVRKQDSALDEAAVLRLCEGRLARYKHPRRVLFLDGLPKNALGKVIKAALRDAVVS